MKKWDVELKETNWKRAVIVAPTREKVDESARKLYADGIILMDEPYSHQLDVKILGRASDNANAYICGDDEWAGYLEYLKEWAEGHEALANYGQSPVCFDEWCDMEYLEEEEDA